MDLFFETLTEQPNKRSNIEVVTKYGIATVTYNTHCMRNFYANRID